MRIGVPGEVKPDEYRVALTPAGARELRAAGHQVLVEAGAGIGAGFDDDAYQAQGAEILADAELVFDQSELITKVKEPQPEEIAWLRRDHILFTYLHLAASEELTRGLLESGATCIAYETIEDENGRLPLLAPMSEVAGRIATQAGAFMLQTPSGGRGLLLGGVPGVAGGQVLVIGGGVVGAQAASVALGMGARVSIIDRSIDRLRELDRIFQGRAQLIFASALEVEQLLPAADLLVGAVLVHGARAPHVVRREQLASMKRRAVLVDVAIDQGGCFETSHPTTHSAPSYEVDGISHYCVANMPGAVPVTSTRALTNATLSYLTRLADEGMDAVVGDPGFAKGVNVASGKLTCEPVARATGLKFSPLVEVVERSTLAPASGPAS